MPINYKEIAFEQAIEHYLINYGGYSKGDRDTFDKEKGIDPTVLISFIQETQPETWEYLEGLQKEKTHEVLISDLCRALNSDAEGCLMVLRHGFKCFGKLFKVAQFAPASGLNPDTQQAYKANRLTITRQLIYSTKHSNSIDVVLSLNGIPVATLELKNPMTRQTWRNAVHQYKNDRDQNDLIFQFKKRTLVHFAVDPNEVYMTTKLQGPSTKFLPFNKGDNNGAGNPDNPNGYKTAYLWEEVLTRESFLDILAQFIHLQVEEKDVGGKKVKKETMIFPRYHQLDSVRKMIADARDKGVGRNCLIQHSAGSGKSNSIAWLAHRLASLHNDKDEKVFDSVIVVTDRLILDQQLQNTIYQFEHKTGVVQKIDENSTQLAKALAGGTPIVITTLQKFPFITEKIGILPKRKYAVIIDEAHSSQSGETAIEMKGVLAAEAIKEEAERQKGEAGPLPDYEEEILRILAKRGRQPNISFFAFTATPKYKTMEMFGRPGTDGKPMPFHLYSMRQAIEEGFILDVLKNYTTYKTYYKLLKSVEDDPQVEKKKAAQALARFMSLHPHNIAQKTEVMVEHFRAYTHHKIGGRAKAMVVTSSRLHAVRYKVSFDKYLTEKGYTDIKALVAFSGTVFDPEAPGVDYTEVGMNKGIKEKELPKKFESDEYQVLLVAEKYQTGFDQPLLHTMYVDKRLSGIQAVQTLSRLNRIHPMKEDTFVLDFVNDPQEILNSFQPYYEQTNIGERADPRQLYEIQAKMEAKQIYYKQEVEEFSKIFYKPRVSQIPTDHAKINACIDPAVSRFKNLEPAAQEEFRGQLVAYRNLYGFLSQVIPFQDSDLEKLYSYVRFLLVKLPVIRGPIYNFDDEVALNYYRLEKISQGSLDLQKGKGGKISGPIAVGTGKEKGGRIELSKLIDQLNDRFSTEFKPADQLFFDSIKEDAVANSNLQEAAHANSMENFGYVFDKALKDLFIDRMDQNEEITAKFINEKEFRDFVSRILTEQVYKQIRKEKKEPDDKVTLN
jgi:type I restriction enzyme R subunit